MKYLIVGDMHGDRSNIFNVFLAASKNNCEKIVCVGDFGYFPNLSFWNSYAEEISEKVKETGIQFSFLDGNHENHEMLNSLDSSFVYPGIEYLNRGKIFDGICFMGGANSIDKEYRTIGVDWFPDERIRLKDYYSILGNCCEVLLSHDCPLGIDFGFKDDFETKNNRRMLLEIVLEMKPKVIIHGHYHYFYSMKKDFGYGPVKVVGLAYNNKEIKEQCVILENSSVLFF